VKGASTSHEWIRTRNGQWQRAKVSRVDRTIDDHHSTATPTSLSGAATSLNVDQLFQRQLERVRAEGWSLPTISSSVLWCLMTLTFSTATVCVLHVIVLAERARQRQLSLCNSDDEFDDNHINDENDQTVANQKVGTKAHCRFLLNLHTLTVVVYTTTHSPIIICCIEINNNNNNDE
jgi:hypothetical protein